MNKIGSVEYLLEPRFTPIFSNGVHYPGSKFNLGQIIKTKYGCIDTYGMYDVTVDSLRLNDRLFKELHWAEKRYEWEMPQYVKATLRMRDSHLSSSFYTDKNTPENTNGIYKVKGWNLFDKPEFISGIGTVHTSLGKWAINSMTIEFLPASEEDFNIFNNSIESDKVWVAE